VDTVTRQLRRIPIAADSVFFPSFSADGGFLNFVTAPEQGTYTVSDPVGVWRARIDREWHPQKPELLIPSVGPVPQDLAVSRDGSRLAVSQVRRQSSLWGVLLDRLGMAAGEPKALIRDSSLRIAEPAFSADGSRLAYASVRQGGDWIVYVTKLDGSSPYPVTPAGQSSQNISWIGNDAFGCLAYRHGKMEYWISQLHGPPKLLDLKFDLGPYAHVAVSRQGTALVAHAVNRSAGINLVLIDLHTGASRELTTPGRRIVFPA
jgi:WD40-like Beta Propeller Repeat